MVALQPTALRLGTQARDLATRRGTANRQDADNSWAARSPRHPRQQPHHGPYGLAAVASALP